VKRNDSRHGEHDNAGDCNEHDPEPRHAKAVWSDARCGSAFDLRSWPRSLHP
jgi:hypothetical protein